MLYLNSIDSWKYRGESGLWIITHTHTHTHTSPTAVYAFIILKDNVTESEEEMIKRMKAIVKSQIGSFAVPEKLLVSEI